MCSGHGVLKWVIWGIRGSDSGADVKSVFAGVPIITCRGSVRRSTLLLRRNHPKPDIDLVRDNTTGPFTFTDFEVAALER